MARFGEGYFDREYGKLSGPARRREIEADLAEEYLPQRGNLPRDDNGDFLDDDMQVRYEMGIGLLHAREFEAFFAWMGLTEDEITEFWDDWREAYGAFA